GASPLQVPSDKPPQDAKYWLKCKTDTNDPDCVIDPRSRRPRKPLFRRDQALRLWPAKSSAAAETRAITFLASRLKTNPNMRRDDAWRACHTKFRLSERGFRQRVWPQARQTAGLEPTAPPGRKATRKP